MVKTIALAIGLIILSVWTLSYVIRFVPPLERTSLPCGEIEEMSEEKYTDRTRYSIASMYECYGARQCRSSAWVKEWEYKALKVGDDPCEVFSNQ